MPASQPELSDFSLTTHSNDEDYLKRFSLLLHALLCRVLQQMGHDPEIKPSEVLPLARSLWQTCQAEGLPQPLLKPTDMGQPGKLDTPTLSRLTAQISPSWPANWPADPAAQIIPQLIKTLLLPEFRACRQSFHEVKPDTGDCPRQALSLCRTRISGSHCVDCPYFLALAPDKHMKFLCTWWEHGNPDELDTHRDTFLPEDFRALRRLLYLYLRHGQK